MKNIGCGTLILILLGVVAVLALAPLVIMLLWNWLMPSIFGLCTIGYWQALGLDLLSGCLFGNGRLLGSLITNGKDD